MESKEDIRNAVTEPYGNVARQGHFHQSVLSNPGCCGSKVDLEMISKHPGYSKKDLASAPDGAKLGLGCESPKTGLISSSSLPILKLKKVNKNEKT